MATTSTRRELERELSALNAYQSILAPGSKRRRSTSNYTLDSFPPTTSTRSSSGDGDHGEAAQDRLPVLANEASGDGIENRVASSVQALQDDSIDASNASPIDSATDDSSVASFINELASYVASDDGAGDVGAGDVGDVADVDGDAPSSIEELVSASPAPASVSHSDAFGLLQSGGRKRKRKQAQRLEMQDWNNREGGFVDVPRQLHRRLLGDRAVLVDGNERTCMQDALFHGLKLREKVRRQH